MYKIYFLLAIIVPALSADSDVSSIWGKTPKIPDVHRILSILEDTQPNSTCCRDFERFIHSLNKNMTWPEQMLDSMEKVPYGLLYGRTAYMGNFDECISANEGNFSGKYCLAELGNGVSTPGFTTFAFGICLPSTCTASELKSALEAFGFGNINMSVLVAERNCYTSDPATLSTEVWLTIAFLSFICIITVMSTIYDVRYRNNSTKSHRYDLYASFSLYRNGQQLVKINNGPGNIGCLHGIRSLSMCWIILCHEYCMGMFSPLMNGIVLFQDFILSKYKIPITNGFVAVDTFFFLSGLLVTLVFFRTVNRTGSYDVPVAMIHRFIRLTPAFAAMVLIQTWIVPELGQGPIWGKLVGSAVDTCKESWWSGLLYIQNLVKPTSSCLGQSWYLSSDMQMFWLSPILLYPLLLWRMKGVIFMFFGLALALTTNFVVSFIFKLGPHLLTTRSERQFDTDYTQTHMRLTPYIIGMAVGYVICGIKANKIKINLSRTRIFTVGVWLASAGLCLGSMYGVIYFMDYGYEGKLALASTYLTFHRLGWSLGIALVILACIAGYGGPVDYFLSWGGFQIIGKISYCMFLVHFTVQQCHLGMTRTNPLAHDFFFVWNYVSTIVFSIIFSIPLHLFFEAPFSNLDRYFLRKLKIFPYPRRAQTESATASKEKSTEP